MLETKNLAERQKYPWPFLCFNFFLLARVHDVDRADLGIALRTVTLLSPHLQVMSLDKGSCLHRDRVVAFCKEKYIQI